jgi:hypothetical protein
MLLVAFSVLLLCSLAWNLWLFSRVTNGEKIGSEQVASQPEIQLGEVKTLFESRAAEQTRYIQEYRFVDPSL